MPFRNFQWVVFALFFFSCKVTSIYSESVKDETRLTRKNMLVVFMDGTSNKPQKQAKQAKNTHVMRLQLLSRQEYRSLYLNGVGNLPDIPGLLWGSGTKNRVIRAYRFISQYYHQNDSICLFGFSRGANQCRILSNLIYTFGILDMKKLSEKDQMKLLKQCYNLYRKNIPAIERKSAVAKYIDQTWNYAVRDSIVKYDTSSTTKITAMGLFDAVEALRLNNKEEFYPIDKDLNQVTNTSLIFHAVSLDDNRANIYTPILVNSKYTNTGSQQRFKDSLIEVWFSGGHRDVGGGPSNKRELSTVSLHWMLNQITRFGLFRDSIFAVHPLGFVHNTANSIIFSPIHKNRNIPFYYQNRVDSFHGKIKIHISVIKRLESGALPRFKILPYQRDWYDLPPFNTCFDKINGGRKLKPDCSCIEVIE